MRNLILTAGLIITFFFSCSEHKLTDEEVEQRANTVIELLNQNTIDTFKRWGYGTRGEFEIWWKRDPQGYSCWYFNKDQLKISVGEIENFKNDFPYTISIDTGMVHQIAFKKIDSENINITAWTNFGADTTIVDKIKLNSFFPASNPFERLAELSKLKDRLQIIATFYRPDIGNFIQFYLTHQHILTYFPDRLEIDPAFKGIWMGYFSTGKMLSKNWNLRKLKLPLDNS